MRYHVTLIIETIEGNPRSWDWEELIGETVYSVEVKEEA